MKYVDIERLSKEINSLYNKWCSSSTGLEVAEEGASIGTAESIFDEVRKIIDSLQQEQQEEPSESLEEAASNYITSYYASHHQEPDMTSLFIAGAEWQKEQDEKEQADLFTIVALDAAQREKEQMLKDAVGGMVCATITNQVAISFFSPLPKELKVGDKIRIVLIKESTE